MSHFKSNVVLLFAIFWCKMEHILSWETANFEDYPYVVVLFKHGNPICGGSILKKNHGSHQYSVILTAAHCVDTAEPVQLQVGVGCSDTYCRDHGMRIQVKDIVIHEQYNGAGLGWLNDIALLYTYFNTIYEESIEIPLWTGLRPTDHEPIIQLSYLGISSTTYLEVMFTNFMNKTWCDNHYDEVNDGVMDDAHMCLWDDDGYHVTCLGDSGTPTIYKHNNIIYQIGLISWGWYPCQYYPDVCVYLPYYVDWINNKLNTYYPAAKQLDFDHFILNDDNDNNNNNIYKTYHFMVGLFAFFILNAVWCIYLWSKVCCTRKQNDSSPNIDPIYI